MLLPGVAAEGDPLSPEERAWVEDHGPIRYAPDPAYPPFEFIGRDGQAEGINVDLLNRMSRNLDIEFETVIYGNWTAVLDAMKAGEVDLLGSLAQTPEREAYMDFYGPYMEVGEVFYVRDDSPLTSSQELEGKRVAVIQDYAAGVWLRENRPDIVPVSVPDMTSGLEAVTTGEVDAFFENIPVAGYVIRQEGFNNIRILGEPEYYSPANWGVPEGEAVLLSIIAKGMDSIPLGEQAAVFEYWSGYDLGVHRSVDEGRVWLTPLVWGLVGVIAAAMTWVVSLRSTVRRRTTELRELNADLERRVHDRTAELRQANDHLEAFASSVSHDLQQPLTVMSMQSRLIASQAQRGEPVDTEQFDRQVKRMSRFIEAMLHFSRASKPGPREDTDIATLVAELRDVLGAEDEDGPEMHVEPGLRAYADPMLLRVVLLNLVGNAWKFTADTPGARIEVGGDGVHFWVSDNGPGFDADALGDKLFEPFVRGQGEKAPGMGIGLATVARIVEAHGGSVRAESAPGQGATIHWTMPRHADPAPQGCGHGLSSTRPERPAPGRRRGRATPPPL